MATPKMRRAKRSPRHTRIWLLGIKPISETFRHQDRVTTMIVIRAKPEAKRPGLRYIMNRGIHGTEFV